MDIINQRLTLQQFQEYVRGFSFNPNNPNKLVIHHTWRPTKDGWQGERTMGGLKRYYEGKGWTSGPHLFIAEDGIWLFTPMNKIGIHAGSLNLNSIGIEVVGDYDREVWSGNTKSNALGTIKILMNRLGLTNNEIYFHRDVSSKSCPGHAITKEWLFAELKSTRLFPMIPGGSSLPDTLRETTVLPNERSTTHSSVSSSEDEFVVVKVPSWAKEAVEFVTKNNLFEIREKKDLRDAVKFHRFYQMLDREFE